MVDSILLTKVVVISYENLVVSEDAQSSLSMLLPLHHLIMVSEESSNGGAHRLLLLCHFKDKSS